MHRYGRRPRLPSASFRLVITSYSIHYTKLYDSVDEAARSNGETARDVLSASEDVAREAERLRAVVDGFLAKVRAA